MTTTADGDRDYLYLDLAFALAYFIHVNKEVAFFVAEDALDELPLMLGNQEKNRKPAAGLSGFWKWGERSRPVRKTVRLNESQMLQWLVYKQSESWERQSESGTGLYLPTEEDMIVRYLEYLVFLTMRRGSFYVTLAIAQLLHQLDRRETRLLYDVLTQSDSARMKDMSYIGKQRLELLARICRRFEHMVHTIKIPGGEKQLVMQPLVGSVNTLVLESLRRFTPWETKCVVKSGFDVTDIPGFYFQQDSVDEDSMEIDRIHTLLDPKCFARFAEGLGEYARRLPDGNQDKSCNFDSVGERLIVPQFSNFPAGPPRGDRFESPRLTQADYVRLERTLDARARRRRSFAPQQLSVYVDNVLTESFDSRRAKNVQFEVTPEAGVIEVRGQDDQGVLTLAILLLEFDQLEVFRDSIVGTGGQTVEVQVAPILNGNNEVISALVEVGYADSNWQRRIARSLQFVSVEFGKLLRGSAASPNMPERDYSFFLKASAMLVVLLTGLTLIWFAIQPSQPVHETVEQAGPATEIPQPVSPVAPPAMPEPPRSSTPTKVPLLIASAVWSTDPQDAVRAIQTEPTRGEVKAVDLSSKRQQLLLSIPLYDDAGNNYSRYRISLAGAANTLWQQTLRAPKISLTGRAHILDLSLAGRHLPKEDQYNLSVEGWSGSGWQRIGHVLFRSSQR